MEVVLGVVVQVWQVGAHFEALVKLESMAPLLLPCIFFTYQTSPPAHCVHLLTKPNVQMWLMAQMKAYDMLMKGSNIFCGTFHLSRLF